MSVPDLSVGCRFADYFAICGLDFDSGLEPDRLCGELFTNIKTLCETADQITQLLIYLLQVTTYISLLWTVHIKGKS